MKKFIIALLVVTLSAVCLFGTACQKKSTLAGWTIVEEKVGGVGDSLQNYAIFRITAPDDSNKQVAYAWVNLSGLTDDSVSLNFAFSNSSGFSSPKEFTETVTKTDLKADNGWVKVLIDQTSSSYSYVEVCVTQSMTFNEIIFVSTTGKRLTPSLYECGARPARSSNSSKYTYTLSELEEKIEAGEVTDSALNLIDEQDSHEI